VPGRQALLVLTDGHEEAERRWPVGPRFELAASTADSRAHRRRTRRRDDKLRSGACTSEPRSSPRGHPCQGRIPNRTQESLVDLIRKHAPASPRRWPMRIAQGMLAASPCPGAAPFERPTGGAATSTGRKIR
jgi:hypothetical protein